MLGEHDQLAAESPAVELVGAKEVCAAPATWCRRADVRTSVGEADQFGQLDESRLRVRRPSLRRSARVDRVVLELLEFLVVEVVVVEVLQVGEPDALRELRDRDRATRRRQSTQLVQPAW